MGILNFVRVLEDGRVLCFCHYPQQKELNELSVVLWTADEERGPDQYNCNTTTVAPVTWWRSVKFLEGELNDDNQAVGVGCTFTIQYQDSGEAISKYENVPRATPCPLPPAPCPILHCEGLVVQRSCT